MLGEAANALFRETCDLGKLAQIPGASEVSQAWLEQQRRYRDLLDQTQAEVDLYALTAQERTRTAQRDSAEAGANDAAQQLEVEIRGSFNRLPANQIERLVGNLADGSPLAEIFSTFGAEARKGLADVLTTSLALGENPKIIARRMREAVPSLSRDRAVLIARTESIRAYRGAQLDTYRANSDVVIGWRWVSARQTRTCPLCWAMHGTIHKLDESMASHPGCRCTQQPVTEYSPQRKTGEEEFRALTPVQQKAILGPGRFELYNEGRITLADTVKETYSPRWGAGRQVKSLGATRSAVSQGVRRGPLPTTPQAAGIGVPLRIGSQKVFPGLGDPGNPGRLSANADPISKKIFTKDVSVRYDGVTEAHVKKVLGFAPTASDLADLSGAPGGSVLTIGKAPTRGKAGRTESVDKVKVAKAFQVLVSHPEIEYCRRVVALDVNGRRWVHNEEIRLVESAKGGGIGSRMLAKQVDLGARLGFSHIECWAARYVRGYSDGYIVWPKLGYDGKIPDLARSRLPVEWSGQTLVSEILRSEGGVDWWRQFGSDIFDAKFDLAEGSYSRERLKKYMEKKLIAFATELHHVLGAPWSEDDERAFQETQTEMLEWTRINEPETYARIQEGNRLRALAR